MDHRQLFVSFLPVSLAVHDQGFVVCPRVRCYRVPSMPLMCPAGFFSKLLIWTGVIFFFGRFRQRQISFPVLFLAHAIKIALHEFQRLWWGVLPLPEPEQVCKDWMTSFYFFGAAIGSFDTNAILHIFSPNASILISRKQRFVPRLNAKKTTSVITY